MTNCDERIKDQSGGFGGPVLEPQPVDWDKGVNRPGVPPGCILDLDIWQQ